MSIRFPFRNLEPTFYSGLLDDPLLLVRVRPTGSSLLFDCGQIHHLAKRVLTSIDAIFVSHAHMDHWLGIDSFTRHLHAASKVVDLFGPPGIADKLAKRLAGYDWNLAEDYWGSYRVHEVFPEWLHSTLLSGPQGFSPQALGSRPRRGGLIFENAQLIVVAESCEHRIPSLIFRITEKPAFLIDEQKLKQQGLLPGPWIRELKRRFFQEPQTSSPLAVLRPGEQGPEEVLIDDLGQLCRQIGQPQTAHSIGYISDLGFTAGNRKKICTLLKGVDLLICETTFLQEGKGRARASFHLCTEDVNWLLKQLQPSFFLPMHLSKTYSRRHCELYRELQPPPETQILQIPLHTTPRPLLPEEITRTVYQPDEESPLASQRADR